MVKQQRMKITQAEHGQHQTFGPVTKVHLEPVESKIAGKPRGFEIVVAELLLSGNERVTIGDIIVLSTTESLA